MVVPSNPITADAHGNISRLLPDGQASGNVVAGWLPAGTRLAMAFGTLPADLLESSSNQSPKRAVLFYATDDDQAGHEVERLIRNGRLRAGERPAASTSQPGSSWAATSTNSSSPPPSARSC